jgi:hypothetical protein
VTNSDPHKRNPPIRIDLVAHRFNVARVLRLPLRKRYPGSTVVRLHRSLLSKLVGIFGFGE